MFAETTVLVLSFTTCVTTFEELDWLFASPPYCAVIVCEPPAKIEELKEALPELFSVALPRLALPSEKVTVPVGVPVAPLRTAVKTTLVLAFEGFRFELSVNDVAACTICVSAVDVLPRLLASPL
jgi:hypothetical protein